ncbi:hypothetical protein [Paenibacillus sophorae]|nr:hypothetical protein [Paenibacillus sophorae]
MAGNRQALAADKFAVTAAFLFKEREEHSCWNSFPHQPVGDGY